MAGKGMLKYLTHVFIGVWMFLLGIMVGRDNAPISFDTSGLHQRLAAIVGSDTHEKSQTVELGFYDALDEPNDPDVTTIKVKFRKPDLLAKQKTGIVLAPDQGEELPGDDSPAPKMQKDDLPDHSADNVSAGEDMQIPRKKAKKKKPLNQEGLDKFKAPPFWKDKENQEKSTTVSQASALEKTGSSQETKIFTIQLASFKDPKDARSYIAQLQKKGILAAMEPTKIDGRTWNRVRLGSFASHDQAKKRLAELQKKQVDGFIIQTKDRKK